METSPKLLTSIDQLKVGDVLFRRKLLVMHVGVYLGDNSVLHNAPSQGQNKTSLDTFTQGEEIFFVSSNVDSDKILNNAEKILKQKKGYHLFKRNCEHTIHQVLELPDISRQLTEIEVWALIGAAYGYTWGRKGMLFGGLVGGIAGLLSLPKMYWLKQKF